MVDSYLQGMNNAKATGISTMMTHLFLSKVSLDVRPHKSKPRLQPPPPLPVPLAYSIPHHTDFDVVAIQESADTIVSAGNNYMDYREPVSWT
jgi:hypothetical protein